MESDDENDYKPVNETKNVNCFYNILTFFSCICTYIKHIFPNQNEDEKKEELIGNNSLDLKILSLEEKEKRNSQ
jgi:hypothetical protein